MRKEGLRNFLMLCKVSLYFVPVEDVFLEIVKVYPLRRKNFETLTVHLTLIIIIPKNSRTANSHPAYAS